MAGGARTSMLERMVALVQFPRRPAALRPDEREPLRRLARDGRR